MPTHSQNEYRRLGDRIRKSPNEVTKEDLLMLQDLRVAFRDPLSVIFQTVESLASKIDTNSVCTYRVKRIESIISKLKRLPKMQLQRAEDIAGCRCIMSSEEKVYELFNLLHKKEDKLPFEIKNVNDYIQNPKSTGYKSIHVNVQIKGDSRRIEIQIRSLSHHNWATMVEITDQIYGLHLKELGREANSDLFDFHYLLSKNEKDITLKERRRIAEIAIKYNYLERIGDIFKQNYITVRTQWSQERKGNKTFFLIATGKDGIPEFKLHSTFDDAEAAYFQLYNNNMDSRNIVLTHIKDRSFAKISTAYSNYFMTYNSIIVRIHKELAYATVDAYNRYCLFEFRSFYKHYLHVVSNWLTNEKEEVLAIQSIDCKSQKSKIKDRDEWKGSFEQGLKDVMRIFLLVNSSLHFSIGRIVQYLIKKQLYKQFNEESPVKIITRH